MSLSEIVEDILHMHDNTKVGICCSFLVIFIPQYLQLIYKEVKPCAFFRAEMCQ